MGDGRVIDAPERIYTNSNATAIITPPAIPLHKTDIEWVRADLAKPRVKPLVWESKRHNGWKDGVYLASNGFASPVIYRDENGYLYLVTIYDTLEAAKTAAQADYESRILGGAGVT